MIMELINCVGTIFIIAYKENTDLLVGALKKEGFSNIEVIRPHYSEEEMSYARTSRCLLNHRNAWKKCAATSDLSIVMEADFVPVVGFARLPLPFDLSKKGQAWGWLYSSGQRLYEIDEYGFIRGHSAVPVATILDAHAASVLIEFVDWEFSRHSPQEYTLWDTYIRVFAQNRGIQCFLPLHSYGEHGGIPNPEHIQKGVTSIHNADSLWNKLHFLPSYAQGSKFKYMYYRVIAKLKSLLRLVSGRTIERPVLVARNSTLSKKIKLVALAFRRICITPRKHG